MSRPLDRQGAWRARCGPLGATAVAVALALVAGGCDRPKEGEEVRVDRGALTRAAASLALSVGEFAERYAATLPTGDWTEHRDRMLSIFDDDAEALGFERVGKDFSVAASASRKGGNNKSQAARQLVAAVHLASAAFSPPQLDYRPGDEAMWAALAASLEAHLDAALASTFDLSLGRRFPSHLDDILLDGVSHVVMVANYNYVSRDGSHPIRARMRALGMEDPPPEFLDSGGNLRLPYGSEPADQIERFENWRDGPSGIPKRNWLWTVAMLSTNRRTLGDLLQPAVDTALK